ncbi:type 1 glutamine amidotransferase [Eubacterium sp.]|uniref:type 1 glutamine amidotransferase n=1 Tax=Eubacterium sp. TaxID=142586 RepID=UPI002FC89DA3
MNAEAVRIAWLFPDTLYLHGERGNILALTKMCQLAGMDVQVDKINFDSVDFNPMDYDFIFCPPGEMSSFSEIIEFLKPKKDLLRAFIDFSNPMLVTGTSIALWGKSILRSDGTTIEGLEIINIEASENDVVYGDDLYYACNLEGCQHPIFGSQIQMMDILLGKDVDAFGELYYGYGNHGGNTLEGALVDNAVFTNTLGPVLVLNPWLTRAFVEIIAKKKGMALDPSFHPTMDIEEKSYRAKVRFTQEKQTNLSNCPMFNRAFENEEE